MRRAAWRVWNVLLLVTCFQDRTIAVAQKSNYTLTPSLVDKQSDTGAVNLSSSSNNRRFNLSKMQSSQALHGAVLNFNVDNEIDEHSRAQNFGKQVMSEPERRRQHEPDGWFGSIQAGGRRLLKLVRHARELKFNIQTLNEALRASELMEMELSALAQLFSDWRPGSNWRAQPMTNTKKSPKVAVVATTWAGYEQIRQWLGYHRTVGVSKFYIFVDLEKVPPTSKVADRLRKHKDVTLYTSDDKSLQQKKAESSLHDEPWMNNIANNSCKFQELIEEKLHTQVAVEQAVTDKMDWIIPLTVFELLHPACPGLFSIQSVLSAVDDNVDTFILHNHEGLPEHRQISNPFTEVTLFRKNDKHVLVEDIRQAGYLNKKNDHHFTSYRDGKSFARVRPGLLPTMSNRWTVASPGVKLREQQANEAGILHYANCRIQDLQALIKNCRCEPEKEFMDKCFLLEFDKKAYLKGKGLPRAGLEQWFNEHRVWNYRLLNVRLTGIGLLLRSYEAQVIVQSQLEDQQSR